MTDTFFTFEYDGERFDLECKTEDAAKNYADTWFAERSADLCLKNGQSVEDTGFIIEYRVTEDGDMQDISRQEYKLIYEEYHGDFKEHNTYGL